MSIVRNIYTGQLQKVIRQCIQIDQEKRYESAEQLSDVLRGKRFSKERILQPLPGFRSKRIFPKVITVIGFILYGCSLLIPILTRLRRY